MAPERGGGRGGAGEAASALSWLDVGGSVPFEGGCGQKFCPPFAVGYAVLR